MISYIKGKVEQIGEKFIVVENGGMGYIVNISTNSLENVKLGKEIKIHTHMVVREDGISLFGFLTIEEIEMFNKLITISGLGPKGAQVVLSGLSPSELMLAIITEDIATLTKTPGVGKKTAQRIVLELKDKINTSDAMGSLSGKDFSGELKNSSLTSTSVRNDAIEAFVSLGYSRSEAVKVVMELDDGEISTQQIIKLGLKKLTSK